MILYELLYEGNQGTTPMLCEVKLYVAGRVFYETVRAANYDEARDVALARNPNATVVSVNAKF